MLRSLHYTTPLLLPHTKEVQGSKLSTGQVDVELYVFLHVFFPGALASPHSANTYTYIFTKKMKLPSYFHMALPYSAYAIATLAYHIPCGSRWVCDAADPCVQPAEVCVRTQPTLGTSTSSTTFYIFSRCHVKWHGRVACLFHTHTASPQLPVVHALQVTKKILILYHGDELVI